MVRNDYFVSVHILSEIDINCLTWLMSCIGFLNIRFVWTYSQLLPVMLHQKQKILSYHTIYFR